MMNRNEMEQWNAFYRRNGLNTLGSWLFGGLFETIWGYLDRDLLSIHTELSFIQEKTLVELNELLLKLSIEKTKEFIDRIIVHVDHRIHMLSEFSKKLEYPSESITYLRKNDGERCEILAEMDLNLSGSEIETVHKAAFDLDLDRKSDLEQACNWLDDYFDLVPGEFLRYFPTYKIAFQDYLADYHIEYFESFIDQIQFYLPIADQPESSTEYTHLRDIFKRKEEFEELIEILRQTDTPVIDSEGNYILGRRKKSAVTAFFDVLEAKGKVEECLPKDLKPLVQDYFQMSISREVLSNSETKVYYRYKEEFESLIPNN